MICQGISSGAESVFVLEGHVRTRVGRGRIAGQMSVATKRKGVGGLSVGQMGDSDLSLLPYGVEKEKLVREVV